MKIICDAPPRKQYNRNIWLKFGSEYPPNSHNAQQYMTENGHAYKKRTYDAPAIDNLDVRCFWKADLKFWRNAAEIVRGIQYSIKLGNFHVSMGDKFSNHNLLIIK